MLLVMQHKDEHHDSAKLQVHLGVLPVESEANRSSIRGLHTEEGTCKSQTELYTQSPHPEFADGVEPEEGNVCIFIFLYHVAHLQCSMCCYS